MPFSTVPPPASVVRLASAVVPPMVPKMVVPVVFTVSACAPSRVEPNPMLPPCQLKRVMSAPSVTASL